MSRLGQIKQTFKSVRIEIKAFLRRQQWKEALIFFCFILLAFGFWLLQSLQQEYEIDIKIPVKYKNVPPDISFTETPPEAITVKVKDKGSVLLNYSFGRSFAPIEANMKAQPEKAGKLVISRKDIESDIKKHLIATTSLLSFEPQHIDAAYSKRIKKEIPAVFEGTVQTNAGFKVSGDISITPRNISVYASDVVLDTLKEIKTVYTEIKKGNKTVTRTIQLEKIDGATLEPTSVTITVPIEEYTEKTLEIPVVCTNLPRHYTLRTFPSVVKVSCSVPLSRFKDVSADDFEIRISFADLEQSASGTLPLQLDKKTELGGCRHYFTRSDRIYIGITGGIGSGKSVVAALLELSGIPVYIADTESKLLTATSPVIREKLIALFGEQLYTADGLDKKRLASHIFGNLERLEQVNAIIHPEVNRHFLAWTERQNTPVCAIESAILFESGFNRVVDTTLMVYAPMEVRIKRALERDVVSREEVIRRIESQLPDEVKKEKSDYVVFNDGKQALLPQITAFLTGLNT